MIKSLDNTEISCVYYQFKTHLEDLDNRLDSRVRTERLDMSDYTEFNVQPVVFIPIGDQEIEQIRESTYYKTINSIVDKLSHIVEMIEEAEPNIKQSLES